MKRILSLDGGGIRGVFSLEVLLKMETLLRCWSGNPNLVLADHFDLFAGTSTGAIIATCLCWGMTVEAILKLYLQYGKTMFTPMPWYRPIDKYFISKFQAKPLSDFLREVFTERYEDGTPVPNADGTPMPADLGSKHLRKGLLVVVRNHSTGSAWPLTNNPNAKYNKEDRPDCNLRIPLWQIVRASTAAPTYFDPEEIKLGGRTDKFIDGGITPYNNPALIAAQTAVLPCYNMNWEIGPDKLRIVSLGTLRFSSGLPEEDQKLWVGYNARKIPVALMNAVAWQQDYLCRCLGECIFGEPLDSEIGNLILCEPPTPPDPCRPAVQPWFSYVRYDKSYNKDLLAELLKKHPTVSKLDAVHAIPALEEIGKTYAGEHVKLEHLI